MQLIQNARPVGGQRRCCGTSDKKKLYLFLVLLFLGFLKHALFAEGLLREDFLRRAHTFFVRCSFFAFFGVFRREAALKG